MGEICARWGLFETMIGRRGIYMPSLTTIPAFLLPQNSALPYIPNTGLM
jgi:hypothetical protein